MDMNIQHVRIIFVSLHSLHIIRFESNRSESNPLIRYFANIDFAIFASKRI